MQSQGSQDALSVLWRRLHSISHMTLAAESHWSIRLPFANRASIVIYLLLKICKVLAWLGVK